MNTRTIFLTAVSSLIYMNSLHAQELSEITNIRLYEHHSSTINGGADIGWEANGSQSGYDFVNNTYHDSFDPDTFGEFTGGEEANIDLVEHNGPFGGGFDYGFTSGESSIWSGEIRGNALTKWMPAPVDFDYDSATDVSELYEAYDVDAAVLSVGYVDNGNVYIAQVRESNLYVAMKVYNVTNLMGPPEGFADVYFDFDYKYGSLCDIDASVSVTDNILTATVSGLSYQWLDCDNDNEPIDGETAQSFEPSENGNYAVEITDGECSVISECYEIVSLGISNENIISDWLIYPNPTNNKLTIEAMELEESTEVILTDMSGRTILTGFTNNSNVLTLDLTGVLSGTYILTNDRGTFFNLIIKE